MSTLSKILSRANTHRARLLLERYIRIVLGQLEPFCVSSMQFISGEDHARFDFESEEGPQGGNTEILQRFRNLLPDKRPLVFANQGTLEIHLLDEPTAQRTYLDLAQSRDYTLIQHVTVLVYQDQGTVAVIKDVIERYGVYLDYFGLDSDPDDGVSPEIEE